MAIKLSQLAADRIRMTIPLFANGEQVETIEIYSLTTEIADEIKKTLMDMSYDAQMWRYHCLKHFTNIDADVELSDDIFELYSDILVSVMVAIDAMIFEVVTNFMMENATIANLSPEKQATMGHIMEQFGDKVDEIEAQLAEIKEQNEQERQKKEAKRQLEEAKIRAQELGVVEDGI